MAALGRMRSQEPDLVLAFARFYCSSLGRKADNNQQHVVRFLAIPIGQASLISCTSHVIEASRSFVSRRSLIRNELPSSYCSSQK